MPDYLWGPRGEKIPINKDPEHFASRDRVGMFLNLVWNVLPDPDIVLAKTGKTYSGLRELMVDEQFETAWTSRLAAVQRTPWDIVPGASDRASKKAADFCRDVYKSYDLNLIHSGLMEFRLFGFVAAELLWANIDNNWIPLNIVPKPQEWFGFDKDNMLVLRTKNNQTEELPPNRFLLLQNKPSYVNPYGEKLLSKIFWSISFKRNGAKWWSIFTEKYGGAFATAQHRPGATQDEINEIIAMLEDLVSCGVATFPQGTQIDIKTDQSKGAATNNFSEFEHFFNENVSKVILGGTLTTDIGSTGSYSAAQVHNDVRADIAMSDREALANKHNWVMSKMTRWNLGDDIASPQWVWEEAEDLKTATVDRDLKLYTMGFRPKKAYISQKYGFSEDDFDVVDQSSMQGMGGAFSNDVPKGLFSLEEGDGDTKKFLTQQAAKGQVELNKLMEDYNDAVQHASSYEDAFSMMVKRYSKQNKFRKCFAAIMDNMRYLASQIAIHDEKGDTK